MYKTAKKCLAIFLALCMVSSVLAGCGMSDANASSSQNDASEQGGTAATKVVTDMRGKDVTIPADPQRVAIFDKGFLVQSMRALGVLDKICATGGLITEVGDPEQRDSMYLFPEIMELPILGYPTDAVDFETLAVAAPDLVILRNSEYIKDSEITADAINKIENDLGLPLVVINGPGCYEEAKLEYQYEGISLLGEVFGKQERAADIVRYMEDTRADLEKRTANLPADQVKTAYAAGISFRGGHGFAGTEANFPPFQATNVKNVADVNGASGAFDIDLEAISSAQPDYVFVESGNLPLVKEDYEANPSYFSALKAVQDGKVSTLIAYRFYATNIELALANCYQVGATVYPAQFADIDPTQKLDEITEFFLGARLSSDLAAEGCEFKQIDLANL